MEDLCESYYGLEVHFKTRPAKEAGKLNLAKFPDRRNGIDDQVALTLQTSSHLGLFKKAEQCYHNGILTT